MDLDGKVAVITGSANGIGRAFATELGRQGCRLVLADHDRTALERLDDTVRGTGVDVLSVPTDVSDSHDVSALAQRVLQRFGRVDVLFNNAGVAGGRPLWEYTDQDWAWQIGVNLLGVAYGIREFVPVMLQQGTDAYVVNTASAAGLVSAGGMAAYNATKHAVVSLSETLHHELRARNAPIGVSVLCPAWVRTNIWDSERYRPERFQTDRCGQPVPRMSPSPRFKAAIEGSSVRPEDVVNSVLVAMRERRFFIFPQPAVADAFLRRAQAAGADGSAYDPMAPIARGSSA